MSSPARQRASWLRRSSLRARIGAILAIAIFAVAGVMGGLIGQTSADQLRARIGQSLATDASRMAERLNAEMAARTRELALLAALDPLRDLNELPSLPPGSPPLPTPPGAQRVQIMLDGLKRSVAAYNWIGITDPNGRVLAATDPATIGTDVSARASFREGMRDRAARGAPRAPDDDTPTMDLASPIRGADGSVVAVIIAQLGGQWLQAVAKTALTPDSEGIVQREMFVVSNRDAILLGPPGTVGQKLTVPAIGRARAGFFGSTVEDWPDGEFLTGNSIAMGEGAAPGPGSVEMRWTVLVREKLAVAFAPAYALRDTILEAGAILAAAFACAGWLIAGWVTAPLKRIAMAAERLRQGDDVEMPRIRGPAEIDSLSASLRALISTLTRKQMALDEMEEIALHDPLTGLLNRHGLHGALQRETRIAQAHGASLLVFVCDLDGFKSVNDSLGHGRGDQLLRLVALRLSQAVRPGDIVARVGGDEFVLVLRAPDGIFDGDARGVARRALADVASPFQLDGHVVQVGCSLGGACWPEHAEMLANAFDDSTGLGGVLEKADAALYAVKRGAKGRLIIHGDRLTHA